MRQLETHIRVLVADDDLLILRCYERAFSRAISTSQGAALDSLAVELFGPNTGRISQPEFELTACRQGQEAVDAANEALAQEKPYDAVILDIRMPPGISGIVVGEQIRRIDDGVPIVFVTGYSDVSEDELKRRIPPASKLHYYRKPLSFSELALDVAGIVYAARAARGARSGRTSASS